MKKILFVLLISVKVLSSQTLNDLSFGSDSTFDVISWNIEWFPNSSLTADYVQTILEQLDADIYALQEIEDTSLLKQVLSNIPDYEGYFNSTYYGGLAYVYNKNTVQINSKYEIYISQPYWNAFPRKPQVLDIIFNGDNYIIINNHFKCCGDGYLDINDTGDEENRRKQAISLLKEYIDNNFNNKKVILLGDLNDIYTDLPSNNVFQELIDDSNYMLIDMQIAQSTSSNWSYPTWPSHLDHIIINDKLFSDFQSSNSLVSVIKIDNYMSSWNDYEQNVSDHRPIGIKLYSSNPSIINDEFNYKKKILKTIDLMGRESGTFSKGLKFNIYESGKVEKIISNIQHR